jgi:hypothetical protein
MSIPQNSISEIIAFAGQTIGIDKPYEVRTENTGGGDPIFVGWSPIANADPNQAVWYIQKIHFDGNGFLNRVEQPVGDKGFVYVWDDRATIFS